MLNRAIGLLLLLSSVPAMAACDNCNQIINLSLTNTLDSQSNAPGKTQRSSSFVVDHLVTGQKVGVTSTSFSNLDGSMPVYGTAPSDWVYQRVDDYLSVAIRLSQSCGYIYAPFNRQTWAAATCLPAIVTGTWAPTMWESSIKVTRRMVGGVYRRNLLLGTWAGCEGICSSQNLIYARVYLNYSITVPENCVLNAGDIVTVDFGSVSTASFRTAGAKAEGVNPIARSIALRCSNIQQQASLTMRVEADNVRGNAIVSNNPDVGFVVTDNNDKRLTPNDNRSLIPFRLDNNGSANVTIKTFPVSVTGRTPTEGHITSRAYLRVDFE